METNKIDRTHFTDNLDFCEILTKWCFAHSVSFSGRESIIITSAVNEYHSQFAQPSDVSDSEIEKWARNEKYYKVERVTGRIEGAKAMRDGQIKPTIEGEKPTTDYCGCIGEGWTKKDEVIVCRHCLKPISPIYLKK